jgi:hypothetical protein
MYALKFETNGTKFRETLQNIGIDNDFVNGYSNSPKNNGKN